MNVKIGTIQRGTFENLRALEMLYVLLLGLMIIYTVGALFFKNSPFL